MSSVAWCQADFEQAQIHYEQAKSNDPVAQLQAKLDSGQLKLEYSSDHGYLPAVLQALGVSPSSQMLVFSKTSFQLTKIAHRISRARSTSTTRPMLAGCKTAMLSRYRQSIRSWAACFIPCRRRLSDKPQFVATADSAWPAMRRPARKGSPAIWCVRFTRLPAANLILARVHSRRTIAVRSTSVGAVGT